MGEGLVGTIVGVHLGVGINDMSRVECIHGIEIEVGVGVEPGVGAGLDRKVIVEDTDMI